MNCTLKYLLKVGKIKFPSLFNLYVLNVLFNTFFWPEI